MKKEAGHDTEVAATPAQSPVRILVSALAGRNEAAIGKHHVRLDQIVDRESELAAQIAVAFSADKRKTYCLYEAPSAEAIRRAAERAGLPADVITEVEEISPAMFA